MAVESAKAIAGPAIKCASTACGLALGGFLGGAFGGMVGAAFGRLAGEALGELGKRLTEAATEKSCEFFVDKSSEPLIERFRKAHPTLEELYCSALRRSLHSLRPDIKDTSMDLDGTGYRASAAYLDWFDNWNAALKKGVALNWENIELPENDLEADTCFKSALERLDAQGAQLRGKNVRNQKAFTVENPSPLPDALFQFLKARLPDRFVESYRDELVKEENQSAFNEKELDFQRDFLAGFDRLAKEVHAVKQDTSAIREGQADQTQKLDILLAGQAAIVKMLEGRLEENARAGSVPESALKEKDALIARMADELEALREQLSARASDPARAESRDAELAKALAEGDLDEALRLQSEQTKLASDNHAREIFTLGTIHELRFEWPKALEAFRQAWELGHNPEHGFKYAHFAQGLNRFQVAIAVYEDLLHVFTSLPDVAMTLNNLAILYSDTQRMQKAEEAYAEALAIRRKLAEDNPSAYLPNVATTLNNLAILYKATQRMQKAEEAYAEALAIRRKLAQANPDAYLSDVAMTLNNLAILYRATQRMQKAEEACAEALLTYRKLAQANPDAYLPDVAMTLNNLAVLYKATQRMRKAEEASTEALAIRRKLAEDNPEAYLPDVATTLNNLAVLYSDTQRMRKAEGAYAEALAIRRKLAEDNPGAYLPDVATTLNNLAVLYSDTQRMQKAEEAYAEALLTYRKLDQANPDAYLPDVAMTLNNLAILYKATQRMQKAEEASTEALAIRRKLAEDNPDAYLPDVATTLNNLANLYSDTQRMRKAEEASTEAERLLQPLWHVNPTTHGNGMARILWVQASIQRERGKQVEACALARRALDAAYDPNLKRALQEFIDGFCSDASA